MEIQIGDKVIITSSPYYSVPNGTITYVEDIIYDHFQQLTSWGGIWKWDLYVLTNLPNKNFIKWEIELYELPETRSRKEES